MYPAPIPKGVGRGEGVCARELAAALGPFLLPVAQAIPGIHDWAKVSSLHGKVCSSKIWHREGASRNAG